jgi:lipopolysaccharide transport system ATP-binding protein
MRRREAFWAVRGVSFEVPAGGALGIIGPNGSGKSTILKMIARISHPTAGTIRIRGRVGALIEVGAGVHPELTGRENIFMYGSLMGLRRREISRKFDSIVDFAGLDGFLDTPLKHYSSGMQVRLGFSVAAHMTTEVLLVDEVLAVGDAAFQTRCLRRMRDLRDEGVAIVLVSHQLAHVQRMCPESVLMVGGKVEARGATPEVISRYYQLLDTVAEQRPEPAILGRSPAATLGRDEIRILGVRLADAAGIERPQFDLGEDLRVIVECEAARPIHRPQVSISFNSSDWTVYTGADTKNDGFAISGIHGRTTIELSVPRLGLGPGLYEVNVGVWDEEMLSPYDWRWGVRRFVVNSSRSLFAGRFMLPHAWAVRDDTESVTVHSPA